MKNELGPSVDKLRQLNNISIHQLIDGIMSSSTYYRFTHDGTEISAVKFIQLLERLDTSFSEFSNLQNPDQITNQQFFTTYLHAVSSGKVNEGALKTLLGLVETGYTKDGSSRYRHYLWLTQSCLDYVHNERPHFQSDLERHFTHLTAWTPSNLIMVGLSVTFLPFLTASSMFASICTAFEEHLDRFDVQKAYSYFLVNFALLTIENQSQYAFVRVSKQLHKRVILDSTLTMSVYTRFIRLLNVWLLHPETFSKSQLRPLATLLRDFNEPEYADQLNEFIQLFEHNFIGEKSASLSHPIRQVF